MPGLKPTDRVDLISTIGREIQARLKVSDIPGYLSAFGIRVEIVGIVPSKWVLVREVLAPVETEVILAIARDLGVPIPGSVSPAASDLARALSDSGMDVCKEDFARALETIESDPGEAIGHACTSLESICKFILDALGVPLPRDESLQALVKAVAKQLELSPDAHADADLKQLLGGLANTAAGIAVMRTKYSVFHGKSPKQRRLVARHARLAVNSAAALGSFLVETYQARHPVSPNA